VFNTLSAATPVAFLVLLVSVVVATARRMLVLRARVRALERQAITDPLTGAFNRRHMQDLLLAAVDRKRRGSEHASLLLIDIDRFKALNDGAGHAHGDRVLREIAALVRQRLRRIDALFRPGGDEFVVLLSGAWVSDAGAIAEELRGAVEHADLGGGRSVSISVGVAELGYDDSATDWLAAADAALYEAKRAGRNRVALRVVRTTTKKNRVS
jgi:diguanylate cyclase (GGDEF)-like protein